MDLAARCLACHWEFLLLGPQTALHFRKPFGNSCHIVIGNYIKRLDQDTEARLWFWDLNHTRFKGWSLICHRKRVKPLGFSLEHAGMLSNIMFHAGRILLKTYFSWICSLQNIPFAPFTSRGGEAMSRRLRASQGKDTSEQGISAHGCICHDGCDPPLHKVLAQCHSWAHPHWAEAPWCCARSLHPPWRNDDPTLALGVSLFTTICFYNFINSQSVEQFIQNGWLLILPPDCDMYMKWMHHKSAAPSLQASISEGHLSPRETCIFIPHAYLSIATTPPIKSIKQSSGREVQKLKAGHAIKGLSSAQLW